MAIFIFYIYVNASKSKFEQAVLKILNIEKVFKIIGS